jgi:hypothetical protein
VEYVRAVAWRGDNPKRTIIGWVLGAIVVYSVLSIIIAGTTVTTCGGADAPKQWQYFPPQWQCLNR